MEAGALIELEDVEFEYPRPRGVPVGDGGFSLHVDRLAVRPGERVACIGPSGCGKSTLVNLMCGLEVPQRGSVRLAGRPISSLPDRTRRRLRASRVGLVFQEFELLEYLTALENILLPCLIGEGLAAGREASARATELAGQLGIAHALRRRPRRLSQGERQRVAICRALVASPDVILCDEPTGNLDPRSREAVLDLLLGSAPRGSARALVMVTHDHAVLGRFDRVIDAGPLGRRTAAAPRSENTA